MTYFGKEDAAHLHDLFPLTCEQVPTRGIKYGNVLKFRTFYLKIYDLGDKGTYAVQAYLYNKQNPEFIDEVDKNQMRAYAKQFTQEDYLASMIALHASQG